MSTLRLKENVEGAFMTHYFAKDPTGVAVIMLSIEEEHLDNGASLTMKLTWINPQAQHNRNREMRIPCMTKLGTQRPLTNQ